MDCQHRRAGRTGRTDGRTGWIGLLLQPTSTEFREQLVRFHSSNLHTVHIKDISWNIPYVTWVNPEKFFVFFARFWKVPKSTHMHVHIQLHVHMHNIHVHMPYMGADGINMVEKTTNQKQKCNFFKLTMSRKTRNVILAG